MEWPMLRVLPMEAQVGVVAAARRRQFSKGQVVFHEGDMGDAIHLIREGHFAVRVNNEFGEVATLRVLGPGHAFGELALVHAAPGHRTATVLALDSTETLSLSGRSFTSLRSRYTELDRLLVHMLAERVEQLGERLLEALYVGVDQRVYRRLIELVAVYDEGAAYPRIPLTQDDLAGMAGATRPTVNQVLRRLAEETIVTLHRGKITITDLQRLRARAGCSFIDSQTVRLRTVDARGGSSAT